MIRKLLSFHIVRLSIGAKQFKETANPHLKNIPQNSVKGGKETEHGVLSSPLLFLENMLNTSVL